MVDKFTISLGNFSRSDGKKVISIRTICKRAVLSSFFIMAGFSISELSPAILFSFILFGVLGFSLTSRIDPKATGIFIIVYSLCTLLSALLYFHYINVYGAPYWEGGSDELEYERLGKEFAENYSIFEYGGIRKDLVPVWHNSVGYIYLVGILTKLGNIMGGGHTMVIRIFNSACLGLISVMVFSLAKRFELKQNTVIWTSLLAGCLPLMIWTAGQSLRDILITMLLITGVYVWTPETTGKQKFGLFYVLFITILISIALFELRRGQAFVLLLVATIGLLTGADKRYKWIRILWIVVMTLISAWMIMKFSSILTSDLDLILMSSESYSTYRTEERGGGLSTIVFSSTPPLSYILRSVYALVSPLPVISSKFYILWLSIGTVFQIFFMPFFFKGIYISLRTRIWWVVVSAFTMLFVGMAMFTFTTRHITQYLPLGVLITALGYEHYRGDRNLVFFTMGGLIGLMVILYLSLKVFTS
jgi:hypothetical protein